MGHTFDEIRSGILSALFELYKQDKQILSINANERSITHRFAIYIEKEFPRWDTDCEYNRDGDAVKRGNSNCLILPDIIVHKRGRKGPNLIVIEAKKDSSSDLKKYQSKDKQKIEYHIQKYKYDFGLFIIFNVEKSPLSADLNWFDGESWENESINLEMHSKHD